MDVVVPVSGVRMSVSDSIFIIQGQGVPLLLHGVGTLGSTREVSDPLEDRDTKRVRGEGAEGVPEVHRGCEG